MAVTSLPMRVEEGADAAVENTEVRIFGGGKPGHAHVLGGGLVGDSGCCLDPTLELPVAAEGFGLPRFPFGVTSGVPWWTRGQPP